MRCKKTDGRGAATKPCASGLNEQVTFVQLSQTKNDTGGFEVTRSTFAVCMASVTPKHGREFLIAGRIDSVDRYEIKMRYLPGINSAMEITWEESTLQIESVILVDGKKNFYSIIARNEGAGT